MKPALRLRWLVLTSVTCLMWHAASGRALAAPLVVEWGAPVGCPVAADVEARVTRLIDAPPSAALTATTQVVRTATGFRARLRILGTPGVSRRELQNADCDILADSVAVVIALLVSTGRPDGASADDAHDSHGSDRGLVIGGSAFLGVLEGVLPGLGVALGGALAVEGAGSLRLELRGAYFFPQSVTFNGMPLGADFRLFAAGLRACRVSQLGWLELAPCVGADLYRLDAKGFGGMVEKQGGATWWAPSAGALGRVHPMDSLAIHVAVDFAMPFARRRFVFSDVGVLHRASRLAFQVLMASEVRF